MTGTNPKSLRTVLRFVLGTVFLFVVSAVLFFLALPFVSHGPIQEYSVMWNTRWWVKLFNDDKGMLPPTYTVGHSGERLHSWRLLVLREWEPFDQCQLDKPWNAKDNEWLLHEPFAVEIYSAGERRGTFTSVVAVTGPETAFEHGTSHQMKDLPPNLIICVSTMEEDVPWMEPKDLVVDADATKEPDAPRLHDLIHPRRGIIVLFADSEIWHLSSSTPEDVLLKFMTITEAKTVDREQLLLPYRRYPRRFPFIQQFFEE